MTGNSHQNPVASASLLDDFFQFFAWLYDGVNFPPQLRQPIETEIQRGLTQNDPTVRGLLGYLAQLRGHVSPPLGPPRNVYRPKLQEFFRTRYQVYERNGWVRDHAAGRILAAVHLAVEQLEPGATVLFQALAHSGEQPVPVPGFSSKDLMMAMWSIEVLMWSIEVLLGEHDIVEEEGCIKTIWRG
jgi:hypothetical protein